MYARETLARCQQTPNLTAAAIGFFNARAFGKRSSCARGAIKNRSINRRRHTDSTDSWPLERPARRREYFAEKIARRTFKSLNIFAAKSYSDAYCVYHHRNLTY